MQASIQKVLFTHAQFERARRHQAYAHVCLTLAIDLVATQLQTESASSLFGLFLCSYHRDELHQSENPFSQEATLPSDTQKACNSETEGDGIDASHRILGKNENEASW